MVFNISDIVFFLTKVLYLKINEAAKKNLLYTDLVYWNNKKDHMPDAHASSNGKSSIVEEQLYLFFFIFFSKKNEASFFRFSSFT